MCWSFKVLLLVFSCNLQPYLILPDRVPSSLHMTTPLPLMLFPENLFFTGDFYHFREEAAQLLPPPGFLPGFQRHAKLGSYNSLIVAKITMHFND